MNGKRIHPALLVALGLLFLWGLTGVYQRFTTGHALTNYGSYVPWGLWVSGYIYFIGLSAGAFLLSSMVYVFGVESLRRVARTALFVAAVTLAMALTCIWFDLGHMWRFWEVFIRPNFTSLMTWMVWLYTAYFLLILAELWVEMRPDLYEGARKGDPLAGLYRLLTLGWRPPGEDVEAARAQGQRTLRVLGALGIPLAVAFHGGVGALFATLAARPYWHSALFPILFLTGALLSGGALLLATVSFTEVGDGEAGGETMKALTKAVVFLLLLDLLLEWAEMSVPAWYRVGDQWELLKVVLFGKYWYVFWIFHILLGSVIPLWLFLKVKTRRAVGVGGFLVATTFLAVRLNLVIPGLVTPQIRGLEEAYVDHRLLFTYVPSIFEWSVMAFTVALGIALYLIGRRVLPLVELSPSAREV
ncbi:MAG: NrfD/PsrC family molybdoenzyme membrane anchor subunit [Gemmatimonadota bacterium]